jgi:hypothetical protein
MFAARRPISLTFGKLVAGNGGNGEKLYLVGKISGGHLYLVLSSVYTELKPVLFHHTDAYETLNYNMTPASICATRFDQLLY